MKFSFFGKESPDIPDHLILYILSLLDPKSQYNAAMVNHQWRDFVALSKDYMALLPRTVHIPTLIRTIPFFDALSLDVLKFKLMTGGMTNTTQLLSIESDPHQYVLRIPGQSSTIFIKREHEAHNAQQASALGLNVPIHHFNPKSGLQLTQFIDRAKPIDKTALERKEILEAIVGMMKTLHHAEAFQGKTLFFERNADLLEQLKHKGFEFPGEIDCIEAEMDRLKTLFAHYDIKLYPSHNDTTPSNFITSPSGLYEIDWEYSSNNDFLWDLVYFCIEAKFNDEQINFVLGLYFGTPFPDAVLDWVAVYKPIIEWWITIWSWTQIINKSHFVELSAYSELGLERYQNTLRYLKSDEYQKAVAAIEADAKAPTFSRSRPFDLPCLGDQEHPPLDCRMARTSCCATT